MCGSKPKVDKSASRAAAADAASARAAEEARQQRITAGTNQINDTFAQFDDAYFDGFKQAELDYYQPQLDNQFADAKKNLTFSLARAGTLNSSVAAEKQADLTTSYNDNLASILSQATANANAQRDRVASEKSSLVSMLNSTGNQTNAVNNALARSSAISAERPSYNPLGDMFGGAANGIGQYLQNQQAQNAYNNYRTSVGGTGSSSRIVG